MPLNPDGVDPTRFPVGSREPEVLSAPVPSHENGSSEASGGAPAGTLTRVVVEEEVYDLGGGGGGNSVPPGGGDDGPDGGEDSHELGRMSFWDHLEELRRRIFYSLIAVAVGIGVCWSYADNI